MMIVMRLLAERCSVYLRVLACSFRALYVYPRPGTTM
jgi:hypothetical protein